MAISRAGGPSAPSGTIKPAHFGSSSRTNTQQRGEGATLEAISLCSHLTALCRRQQLCLNALQRQGPGRRLPGVQARNGARSEALR